MKLNSALDLRLIEPERPAVRSRSLPPVRQCGAYGARSSAPQLRNPGCARVWASTCVLVFGSPRSASVPE